MKVQHVTPMPTDAPAQTTRTGPLDAPAGTSANPESSRLVIVSNRLPFTVSVKEGTPRFRSSSGGLTTGLWSYLDCGTDEKTARRDFLWVGWPGSNIASEHREAVSQYGQENFNAQPVFLPEESMERFYHGFCNKTLWPLFHYFPSLTRYEDDYWREYQDVNRRFADAVAQVLRPGDAVWVHDYQLMLLPRMIREQFPEIPIGFFLHIPFPSYEVFRLLPGSWRNEIVEGLLGSSLVGFHTHDYTRHFLSCVLRTVGHEHQLGTITLRDRVVKADTFPMGVDFERFAGVAASPDTAKRVEELRAKCRGMKVIFSVDRLDYTKGLINRLRGYESFLKTNAHWRGKVVFIVSVAPSRTGVESYQAMKQELEETVGRIVGAYGNVHWSPLIYQYRNLGFDDIVALYRLCDVALITPLRDGMNLVAKEFIASRPDHTGVLVLSEMAGAAKEMGEALIINPFHHDEFAQAIGTALSMPPEEQVRRNQLLQERLRRYDVKRWAEDFVDNMLSSQYSEANHRARSLSGKAHATFVREYQNAARRVLLLDYDGTLVPFVGNPKHATPDPDLLACLKNLAENPANEVAIVSGRPRSDLQEWFGHLPISLIAEHGVCVRPKGGDWRQFRVLSTDWKERVRPILQLYVDRLPGAMLEEKEFSLVWHFRRADPEQASIRATELLDDLSDYTRNIDVQVLEGNKVLEIRCAGVNKGVAAVEWLGGSNPDFLLAIGDDWTDEDLFRSLPPSTWSIRVGLAQTAARFHLSNHTAVRRLLRELMDPISHKHGSVDASVGTMPEQKHIAL